MVLYCIVLYCIVLYGIALTVVVVTAGPGAGNRVDNKFTSFTSKHKQFILIRT